MKRPVPNPLFYEIERFSKATGIAMSRVEKEGAGNGDLIKRLRKGGRLWPETEQKIRDYMSQFQPIPTPPASSPGGRQPNAPPAGNSPRRSSHA